MDASFTAALIGRLLEEAGVRGFAGELPAGVTATVRRDETREWTFLMNATGQAQTVPTETWGAVTLAPWEVAVRERTPEAG